MQVGGSDQWGNITAGTDLVRKLLGEDAPQCYGLTFPLLVRTPRPAPPPPLSALRLSRQKPGFPHRIFHTRVHIISFLLQLHPATQPGLSFPIYMPRLLMADHTSVALCSRPLHSQLELVGQGRVTRGQCGRCGRGS